MDLNCDSLSICCEKSDCSSSIYDSDYGLDPSVGEVHDRPNFEDQPELHEKYFDDYSSVFTKISFDWEY